MANQICFRCFKIKGDYEVCPHCGYVENTKAKQAYQLKPGTILRDRYIIGTSIGFGGFGITYKAFDTALSLVVAVKEFYPAGLVNRGDGEVKVGVFSGEKEEEFKRQLERFKKEAQNMAIFSKEKDIINVFDFFEENQTAYTIMEYVDAPLLKTRLREEGRLPVEEAVAYMRAILDALSKIHENGIIHKDISPDNIFLTGPDTIKIFDFGAAKFQGAESERTQVVVVKAGYTPPEQYRSKNAQGAFMDIYAAGAVFYEMLTGEKPMDAPDRAVSDELRKPSEYGIEIEERLERVILKALALRPELRFQSAKQFKDAIAGSKKVDLPKEQLQKSRIKRRILAVGSAAVLAVSGTIVLLSQTIFSGRGKLDVSEIEEDEIEVWLSVSTKEEGEKLSQALCESVKRECPQLTLTVRLIDEDEYAKKRLEAIAEANLPEVFCTDGIEAWEYCEELSELLNTMDASSYMYFGDTDGETYELATAAQVAVAYLNEEKALELPEAFESGKLPNRAQLGYADEEGVYERFQSGGEPVFCIAGDLSDLDSVKEVTVEKIPPTDFKVVPVLKDGELLGCLQNCYGVNMFAEDNKKKAGMFVLSQLLSGGVQSAAYMDNEEGIPLNKDVLERYKETKMTTYLAFLKEYRLEDAKILKGDGICEMIREQEGGE